MFICAVALTVACSDDNNKSVDFPIDQQLAGTYKGKMSVSLDGTTLAEGMVQRVSVTKASGDALKLRLTGFSLGGFLAQPIDITIDNCLLTQSGSDYNFSGSQTLTLPDPIGECPTTLDGTIDKNESISLRIAVKATVGGAEQNIKVNFTGAKLAGEENSDATIKTFTLADPEGIVLEQPAIDQTTGTITFKVSYLAAPGQLKLTPTIALNSDKATIEPASGVEQDFSGEAQVIYTVTAEDGTQKVYTVIVTKDLENDATIKTFTLADPNNIVSEQPVIDETAGTITFRVLSTATDEQLKLTPTIELNSGKATIDPASGVEQDFSKGAQVAYTVTAEDGTQKIYKASAKQGAIETLKYDFEKWAEVKGTIMASAYVTPEPTNELASSEPGAASLKLLGIKDSVLFRSEDAKMGTYAAKLVTLEVPKEKVSVLIPGVISGSLFTGSFALNATDRLKSTKFGIPYTKIPLSFTGWYKYAPGAKFIDASDPGNILDLSGTKTDECAIQAILYEAEDENGEEVTLNGHDINGVDENGEVTPTAKYRVAVAKLTDGTARAEYTHFELPFNYLDGKSYDPAKKYKLAIVCASSKEGDYFRGAGGSTLILDDLEVTGEVVE
jgi:hypothetical protein